MLGLLGRSGLLLAGLVIIWLAWRLHRKGGRAQKITATIAALIGGMCLVGTVVGSWMANISGASPYLAAAVCLLSCGGLIVDWWGDRQPDRFAFWCAVAVPLGIIFGLAQLSNLGDEIGKSANQVSTTINQEAPAAPANKPAAPKPTGR